MTRNISVICLHCRLNPHPSHKPRAHFGHVMRGQGRGVGRVLVHSNMDIVDQTKLFSKLDPFHVQFIPAPARNAGKRNQTFNKRVDYDKYFCRVSSSFSQRLKILNLRILICIEFKILFMTNIYIKTRK